MKHEILKSYKEENNFVIECSCGKKIITQEEERGKKFYEYHIKYVEEK